MNLRATKYLALATLMMCSAGHINAQENNVPAARRHRESPVRIQRVESFTIKDTTEVKDIINVNDTITDNINHDDNVIILGEEENEIEMEQVFDFDLTENDSLQRGVLLLQENDTVRLTGTEIVDTLEIPKTWIPDPKKALWMAIAIPGGGQIYNRKFWKLPIIYGGFLGCLYAINWNNTMYRDYAQAFIDISDDDPNTKSYVNFLPISYDVDANVDRLKTLFKKKKDYYRRYRDLSVFCMIGVYALSIIDAYVDAELSSFDITRDLSMKVKPSVITDRATAYGNQNSYGLKCSIAF